MRFEACGDIAWGAVAAGSGAGHRHEDGDCGVLEARSEVMDVSAGDFEHKGAVTSDGLVSVGLRVDICIVIGGVQEESMGLVDASVV